MELKGGGESSETLEVRSQYQAGISGPISCGEVGTSDSRNESTESENSKDEWYGEEEET